MSVVEFSFTVCFQWIYIEESVSAQADTGQSIVEQGDFGNVQILGIPVVQEQTLVEEYIGNGRTCFVVSSKVRQFIRFAETFQAGNGSQTTSDVHTGSDQIVPNGIQGEIIVVKPGKCIDLCHSCIEVSGSYGMSNRFRLFLDRSMLLGVGRSVI